MNWRINVYTGSDISLQGERCQHTIAISRSTQGEMDPVSICPNH